MADEIGKISGKCINCKKEFSRGSGGNNRNLEGFFCSLRCRNEYDTSRYSSRAHLESKPRHTPSYNLLLATQFEYEGVGNAYQERNL